MSAKRGQAIAEVMQMKPRLKDEIAVSDIEPSLTISPEKVCFITIKA